MLYKITVENITPCGGEKYAVREIIEAEAESWPTNDFQT